MFEELKEILKEANKVIIKLLKILTLWQDTTENHGEVAGEREDSSEEAEQKEDY